MTNFNKWEDNQSLYSSNTLLKSRFSIKYCGCYLYVLLTLFYCKYIIINFGLFPSYRNFFKESFYFIFLITYLIPVLHSAQVNIMIIPEFQPYFAKGESDAASNVSARWKSNIKWRLKIWPLLILLILIYLEQASFWSIQVMPTYSLKQQLELDRDCDYTASTSGSYY